MIRGYELGLITRPGTWGQICRGPHVRDGVETEWKATRVAVQGRQGEGDSPTGHADVENHARGGTKQTKGWARLRRAHAGTGVTLPLTRGPILEPRPRGRKQRLAAASSHRRRPGQVSDTLGRQLRGAAGGSHRGRPVRSRGPALGAVTSRAARQPPRPFRSVPCGAATPGSPSRALAGDRDLRW